MSLLYRSEDDQLPRDFDDLFPDSIVFLYDPRIEPTAGSIGNRFRQLDPGERLADIVVIRGDATLPDSVDGDQLLSTLLKDTTTYVMAPDPVSSAAPRLTSPAWKPDQADPSTTMGADATRVLCHAEVNAILLHSDALWHSDDTSHFELPSGQHASDFIRIAEALGDPLDIERIADWVLPHLTEQTVLLADTGGLMALLLQLKLLVLQRFGWDLTIDAFQQYPQTPIDIEDVLPKVVAGRRPDRHLLFLISVNSSGRLLNLVRSLTPPDVTLTCLALCDTSGSDQEGLSSLSTEQVTRWQLQEDGTCSECAGRQITWRIDRRSYERIPYRGEPKAVELDIRRAEANKELWSAVQRSEAVHLHYTTDGVRGRHHAVYLDIPALLTDTTFRSTTIDRLGEFLVEDPPELVLIPEHQGTPALQMLLSDTLDATSGLPRPIIHTIGDGPFDAAAAAVIGPARKIVILDDGIVSGSTVNALRSRVYDVNQVHGHNGEVGIFAVVIRPHRAAVLKRLKRRFRNGRRARIGWTANILLPAGDVRSCPWCVENELLKIWSNQFDPREPLLSQRIQWLSSGEMKSPLLLGDTDDRQGLLTAGAFWGDLDERTAFAAVTAGALAMAVEVDAPNDDLAATYASLELLFDAYYDPIIKAAALRTFQRRHIRFAAQDPKVNDWVKAERPDSSHGLLSELALAAATGKIPAEGVYDLLGRAEHCELVGLLTRLIEIGLSGGAAPGPTRSDRA